MAGQRPAAKGNVVQGGQVDIGIPGKQSGRSQDEGGREGPTDKQLGSNHKDKQACRRPV